MKCIIIHGCPSNAEKAMDPETRTYDKHWISWIKQQLISKGIDIKVPLMPEPWKAEYSKWKDEFNNLDVDERTILIGHSCGCAFLVRWLGETKQKIDKLILVAPWKIAESGGAEKGFYDYYIDTSIKRRVNKIVIFTADDEEEDGKKSAKIFSKALNGKIIELKRHGHYTLEDMETIEFPELINEIIEDGTKETP